MIVVNGLSYTESAPEKAKRKSSKARHSTSILNKASKVTTSNYTSENKDFRPVQIIQ